MNDLPVPVPTELTAPYWAAAAQGVLALQRCGRCRRFVHFPEHRCPSCRSTSLAFEPVRPHGVIAARTVVHRPLVPGASPPYTLAWVELTVQEGLRVFGAVEPCMADAHVSRAPEVGSAVEVIFCPLPGFGRLPFFRPLGAGPA